MLEEIIAGVLSGVVAAAGKRIARALPRRGRLKRQDAAALTWLDSGKLTAVSASTLPALPPGTDIEQLRPVLVSTEVQALVHELLALRLSGGPDARSRVLTDAFTTLVVPSLPIAPDDAVAAREFAVLLFNDIDSRITGLVTRLRKSDPELLLKIRQDALVSRLNATMESVDRHVAALSDGPLRADARDFASRYRRHVREHHGKLQPPDFQRRRRVRVDDLYVDPIITELGDDEPGRPPRQLDLRALDSELDRAVLLGDPGGGKTTASNVVLYRHARDSSASLPFLVTLRDFADDGGRPRSVVEYLAHRLTSFYQCPPPPLFLDRLLLSGGALVVFDGLDELTDSSRRAEMSSVIERFGDEYPLCQILVTSRIVGYDQARLDDRQFAHYRLDGFSGDQVTTYVERWFAQEPALPEPAGETAERFLAESSTVEELRTNPLMLSLMCILYRGAGFIPRNRPEIFEQCTTLLFRRWDASRRIHAELQAPHLIEPAVRHLAHWLYTRDQIRPTVTEAQLRTETAGFLHGRGFESPEQAHDAAAEFIGFCRDRAWVFSDVGTTPSGERLYAFTHRTFLEYFAAAHLAGAHDSPEALARALAPRLARQDWGNVADLAIQIKDRSSDRGADRILTWLLGERRHRSDIGRGNVLEGVARSLHYVDPAPAVVRQISRSIVGHALRDLPSATACRPLMSLLANASVRNRDWVRAEIGAIIAESAPPDPGEISAALTLGVNLGWLPQTGPRRDTDYWYRFSLEIVNEYRDQIVQAAGNDYGMLLAAYLHNLASFKELSGLRQGDFACFFRTADLGYSQIQVASIAAHVLYHSVGEMDFLGEKTVDAHLHDIAAIARDAGPPPWIHDTNLTAFRAHKDDSRLPPGGLTGDALIGAAAIFLIQAEVEPETGLEWSDNHLLGRLEALAPYVHHRNGDAQPLPDLPIDPHFAALFRQWAHNEINFVTEARPTCLPAGSGTGG